MWAGRFKTYERGARAGAAGVAILDCALAGSRPAWQADAETGTSRAAAAHEAPNAPSKATPEQERHAREDEHMAVDIYLQLPGIPGAATERDHEDWIELTSATWGVEQSQR